VSKDQLKTIREQTEKGQKSDAIVMGKEELERIKASTQHVSKDQVLLISNSLENANQENDGRAKGLAVG
jgi:hypothetical protein